MAYPGHDINMKACADAVRTDVRRTSADVRTSATPRTASAPSAKTNFFIFGSWGRPVGLP